MAGNKKIFDLPLRTGVTADDRLAIVDSGNTTTYSVKLSDLQDGTGVNTLESLTGNITFSGTNIDITTSGQTIYLSGSTGGGGGGEFVPGQATDSIQPDYYSPTAIGTANYNDKAFLGGGYLNTINTSLTTGNIGAKTIVGGTNNSLNYYSREAAIFGGRNNAENNQVGFDPSASVIVGGADNLSNFWQGNMFGTTSSDNLAYYYNAMVGGYNNNIPFGNRDASSIIGGKNNTINGGTIGTIIGGDTNVISSGARGIVLGGQSNTASGNNAVVSGFANTASGEHSAVIGGGGNNRAERLRSVVVGGESNKVNGGQGGVVVGGFNNTVSHNRSVILGGQFNTTLQDDEAVAYKLRITQYASLDFPDDATAAANGVQLGELYHNAGAVRIRIV